MDISDSAPGASDSIENNPSNKDMNEPKIETLDSKIKDEQSDNKPNTLRNAAHPILCVILITVKVGNLADFLLLSLFVKNEALIYLSVIIIGAIDFWITKNVAGRRLVGLRWWNEIKETGEEVWIFESKNESIYII